MFNLIFVYTVHFRCLIQINYEYKLTNYFCSWRINIKNVISFLRHPWRHARGMALHSISDPDAIIKVYIHQTKSTVYCKNSWKQITIFCHKAINFGQLKKNRFAESIHQVLRTRCRFWVELVGVGETRHKYFIKCALRFKI